MSPQPRTTQHFQQFKTNFCKTLKVLCETRGSINKVCLELGVNRQQFAKYLSGSTLPSIYAVQRMADYFEVDADVFFVGATPSVSKAALARSAPSVASGYYLEYAGVISDGEEAMRVSAWHFYKSGTHMLCHGEVPETSQRIGFARYRGDIHALGVALTLNATAVEGRAASVSAVMSPFEAGPTDYIAISLHGASAGKAEAISSVSIFRYAGPTPDLVDLVSSKCGTFQKNKFAVPMQQIWALLVRQCSVHEATVALRP